MGNQQGSEDSPDGRRDRAKEERQQREEGVREQQEGELVDGPASHDAESIGRIGFRHPGCGEQRLSKSRASRPAGGGSFQGRGASPPEQRSGGDESGGSFPYDGPDGGQGSPRIADGRDGPAEGTRERVAIANREGEEGGEGSGDSGQGSGVVGRGFFWNLSRLG